MPSTSLTGDPHTWPFSRPSLAAHGREIRPTVSQSPAQHWFSSQATTPVREPGSPPLYDLWPFVRPVFADGGRINGHFSSLITFSLSSSPRVPRSPTVCLAVRKRVLRCGILCSPVFSLCSSPCISPPVSLTRYGMVGTVAGDGAPRSLSDFRSSGVCWTRPFSFSDSSLDGLRPFWLLLFHPALPFFCFLGLAVLADASTAFAIVSHQPFSLGHNWHYSPLVGLLANSLLYVPKNSHIPLLIMQRQWAGR